MFNIYLKNKPFINPDMLKYIRESTNKSIEKYLIKKNDENNINTLIKVNDNNNDDIVPNIYFLVSFVSLVSFLAGYKFAKI